MSDYDTTVIPAQDVEELLIHPPKLGGSDSPFTKIISYLVMVAYAIQSWVEALLEVRDRRIAALERTPPPIPTTTSSRATSASRCTRCHTRGHPLEECKSTDPAAVKRRVAQNAKARERRRKLDTPVSLPPSHLTPASFAPAYEFYTQNRQFALMATESAELRRREAQSKRDRRRAFQQRRDTSTPSGT